MPDKHGKFRPVAFPAAPWCARCKLFVCACEPASKPLPAAPPFPTGTVLVNAHVTGTVLGNAHVSCGTPRCCGTC